MKTGFHLPADLQEMEQAVNTLRSSVEKLPIAESEIGTGLKVKASFIQIEILSQRLANLQKRLAQLAAGRAARYQFDEDVQMALSPIVTSGRSNSF